MKTQPNPIAVRINNYTLACQAEHDRLVKDAVRRAVRLCEKERENYAVLLGAHKRGHPTEGAMAVWRDTQFKSRNAVRAVKSVDFDEYMKLKKRFALAT